MSEGSTEPVTLIEATNTHVATSNGDMIAGPGSWGTVRAAAFAFLAENPGREVFIMRAIARLHPKE